MSLLDKSTDDVIVYLQEAGTDEDGNTRTRPSDVGIPARVRIQVIGQSGTSSRRQEQDNEGFESERVYSIRFPRSWPHEIGMQSQIEWQGKRWVIFGDVNVYNSSPRTAHKTYTIKRF
ncbi:hypothetical protein A5630_23085 [Mycolicibacterium mucogenicum]|uniref:Head-to-tail stopper n=1 Tax=Mycolicibacterium mucogenicum TaxID=56689 RepID=A0A1A3GZ59_MYCMU|nr:hypothetical protein [Mycolicibacterium mucogenicum]OBJ41327.1 hypothetical protein A5630_23085 [Mycolicibacterium mucogenicum]